MTHRLVAILESARRLRDQGPGSMYPEHEALHMANQTLDLLIEALEVLSVGETTGKD